MISTIVSSVIAAAGILGVVAGFLRLTRFATFLVVALRVVRLFVFLAGALRLLPLLRFSVVFFRADTRCLRFAMTIFSHQPLLNPANLALCYAP